MRRRVQDAIAAAAKKNRDIDNMLANWEYKYNGK